MTDFSASDDELLSSFIDGDLTADERTRLDTRLSAEPALRSRLDQLRAAAELAATPVDPVTREQGESLIAAALAAGTTTPAVTDLAAARAARAPRWGLRIATAAAGVLLLTVAIPSLVDLGDSDDDVASSGEASLSVDDSLTGGDGAADDGDGSLDSLATGGVADAERGDPREMDEDGDAESADDGGDDGADSSTAMAPAMQSFTTRYGIEPFADGFDGYATADELREEIVARYDAVAATIKGNSASTDEMDPTQGDWANLAADRPARLLELGIDDCATEVDNLESSLAPILAVDDATATLDGAPVAILLYALADGRVMAQVVDPTDCTIIESVELNPAG